MFLQKALATTTVAAALLFTGCGVEEDTGTVPGEVVLATKPISIESKANALLTSMRGARYVVDTMGDSTLTAREAINKFKLSSDANTTALLENIAAAGADVNGTVEAYITNVLEQKVLDGIVTETDMAEFIASYSGDLNDIFLDVYGKSTTVSTVTGLTSSKFSDIFTSVGDTIKDGLVDVLDTSVGSAVTSAAFDLVLNSQTVTTLMLDMARASDTLTQIMIDALGNDWSLTVKMCPMLQTDKEFGEKFAALAWEKPAMANFFFETVDAPMYNCLSDAMLLSGGDDSNVSSYHADVNHTTTAYMGMLMNRHAADFFILPGSDNTNESGYGRKDNFIGLLYDTKNVVAYTPAIRDSENNITTSATFDGHGDGTELINEKFFYALFKTPTATENFVEAMNQLPESVRVTIMDHIFLGEREGTTDTFQGYLNIIAIASGMYDGISGKDGSTVYGIDAYTNSFVGFAGLIPFDKYYAYGAAFISAGLEYADMNGISLWNAASESIWGDVTGTITSATAIQTGTAGNGTLDSDWGSDIADLAYEAWADLDLWALFSSEFSTELANTLGTLLDGVDADGNKTLSTTTDTGATVYGLHGLIELAIKEDMVNTGLATSVDDANFTLPAFADMTWSFAYNSAADAAATFYETLVVSEFLADLSTNELVREYFYPDANNTYIPSWMLSIDWLAAADNVGNTNFATTDFNFDSGYLDVYLVSKNADLVTELDLATAVSGLKENITMTRVEMGDDTVIAVDASGTNLDALYVYKIRIISPEDVALVLNYLYALADDALSAVGLDADTVTNVYDEAAALLAE